MVRKGRSKTEWTLWAVFAVALVVGIGSLVGQQPAGEPSANVLVISPTVPTSTSPGAGDTTTSAATTVNSTVAMTLVGRSQPRTLLIPSINVVTRIGSLGLQPDGQVMVPANVHTVGWYRLGPTPGQVGASVILGHVDSYVGPGVFFYLKDLREGAKISVVLTDGETAHFKVMRVVEYSKTNFPDRLVYTSRGTRELNLVTCGGTFDHATGHYESNIVVFSQYTGVTR